MQSVDEATAMIRKSFAELVKTGLIPKEGGQDQVNLEDDTVIFGSDSPLDSISFVTLISDVEEKLHIQTGNDLASDLTLKLTEVDGFDENNPNLTVRKLAEFIVSLS